MSSHLDSELSKSANLKRVMLDLEKRARTEPRLLYSAPVYPELSLNWVLQNKHTVIKGIKRAARNPHYQLDVVKHSRVVLDKARDFYINAWPERILLMNMARIMTQVTDPMVSDAVFSFRKGRGPHAALRQLSAYLRAHKNARTMYVVKRDITKYGDSIPQQLLLTLLEAKLDLAHNPGFKNILVQALRCHYRSSDGSEACMATGIPSGSPLVPALENFFLTPLDQTLNEIPGAFYARYGDDFLFATPDRSTAENAIERIVKTVGELGLTIKPEKCEDLALSIQTSPQQVVTPGFVSTTSMEWLGAQVEARGRVARKNKHRKDLWKALKAEVNSLVFTAREATGDPNSRRRILGAAMRELISIKSQTSIASYIYHHADARSLKEFDRLLSLHLVERIRRCWHLKKSEAWKVYRSLNLPSTWYMRFGHRHKARKHRRRTEAASTRRAA